MGYLTVRRTPCNGLVWVLTPTRKCMSHGITYVDNIRTVLRALRLNDLTYTETGYWLWCCFRLDDDDHDRVTATYRSTQRYYNELWFSVVARHVDQRLGVFRGRTCYFQYSPKTTVTRVRLVFGSSSWRRPNGSGYRGDVFRSGRPRDGSRFNRTTDTTTRPPPPPGSYAYDDKHEFTGYLFHVQHRIFIIRRRIVTVLFGHYF